MVEGRPQAEQFPAQQRAVGQASSAGNNPASLEPRFQRPLTNDFEIETARSPVIKPRTGKLAKLGVEVRDGLRGIEPKDLADRCFPPETPHDCAYPRLGELRHRRFRNP